MLIALIIGYLIRSGKLSALQRMKLNPFIQKRAGFYPAPIMILKRIVILSIEQLHHLY